MGENELRNMVVDFPTFHCSLPAKFIFRDLDRNIEIARCPLSTMRGSNDKNAATSSIGLTVADNPIRCGRSFTGLAYKLVESGDGQSKVRRACHRPPHEFHPGLAFAWF